MLKKTVTLNNGREIPVIGLGTWQTPNDISARVVKEGIEVGYIHIDTAVAYQNEEGVGQGLKDSGVDRKKIYITSKIRSDIKDYEGAKREIEESLERLGTGYIDLMLIHCPCPWREYRTRTKDYFKENLEVWKAMEEAYDEGKILSLGISNFNIEDTRNILEHCRIKPAINQIPWYIGRRDEPLRDYCHKNGILIESYSPLGTGRLLDREDIKKVADKYGVSVPQLCIRFALQDVDITLPKTTHKEFMIQNAQVDFEISKEDFEYLKRI